MELMEYNCFGYSINRYDWLRPFDEDDDLDVGEWTRDIRDKFALNMYNEGHSKEEVEEAVLKYDIDYIESHYPNLRQITFNEIKQYNHVCAYRIYFDEDDSDFHFKKFVRDEGWTEKHGARKIQKCDLCPNLPWKYKSLKYTSRIVYFAVVELDQLPIGVI